MRSSLSLASSLAFVAVVLCMATASQATNFCTSKANGYYCNGNVLTDCVSKAVHSTSTCTAPTPNCVQTGSTTAQCENTFCVGKANGVYCQSGQTTNTYTCSGGQTTVSACGTSGGLQTHCYDPNAVDPFNNGVPAVGGAAYCYATTNTIVSECANGGWSQCNQTIICSCSYGFEVSILCSPANPGQTCYHHLQVYGGGLAGTKSCSGKTLSGFYCLDGASPENEQYYYCPGSANLPQEQLPASVNPSSCAWSYAPSSGTCANNEVVVGSATFMNAVCAY